MNNSYPNSFFDIKHAGSGWNGQSNWTDQTKKDYNAWYYQQNKDKWRNRTNKVADTIAGAQTQAESAIIGGALNAARAAGKVRNRIEVARSDARIKRDRVKGNIRKAQNQMTDAIVNTRKSYDNFVNSNKEKAEANRQKREKKALDAKNQRILDNRIKKDKQEKITNDFFSGISNNIAKITRAANRIGNRAINSTQETARRVRGAANVLNYGDQNYKPKRKTPANTVNRNNAKRR